MAVIMDGLNSLDDTIRKSVCRFSTSAHTHAEMVADLQTLRLLYRLSPDLLHVTFDNLLANLRTSSDLALPLEYPTSLAAKTTAGRLETSSRALEVAEILHQVLLDIDRIENGRSFGKAFAKIVGALNEGVLGSSAVPSIPDRQASSGGQVWEEGLRRVLAFCNGRE